MLNEIINTLQLIFLLYLGLNVGYIAFFCFTALFYKHTDFKKIAIQINHRFVVMIPAYKNDEIILNTVGHALQQNYPTDKFDVIVIADSMSRLTIAELLVMPIKLIPVQFEVSTKAKSLNTALGLIPQGVYDYCVVLDVDNVMEPDFLKKMNARLQNGEIAVQGHRTAKNLDTPFAILDGVSEEINNFIFRKGHTGAGLSSALSGSGQVIQFDYFKQAMEHIHSPVEDKELEFYLVKNRTHVYFEQDALVFDEKVQNSKVFMKQRKRWVASQFFDFNLVLLEGIANLVLHRNLDFFDKSLQRILLPRILLLGLTTLSACSIFFEHFIYGPYFFSLFVLCVISYLLAIPPSYFNLRTLNAAIRIPQAFFLMFYALVKSRGAARVFHATSHSSTMPVHQNEKSNSIDKQVSSELINLQQQHSVDENRN